MIEAIFLGSTPDRSRKGVKAMLEHRLNENTLDSTNVRGKL